mmetsp:Transcript_21956/g.62332  ORF Transcript_21956/g.62332 Transcript_21956/m.62332 type:complete len:206 (+) Transcript_21956:85-702(+)
MSVLPTKVALPLFWASILSALASRDNKLDLSHLSVAEIPLCWVVAPQTYPGFCEPFHSGFACYSSKAQYTPLDKPNISISVTWACSPDLEVGDMTDESCKHRSWNYKGWSGSSEELEFSAEGIYEGMCKLGTPTPSPAPESPAPTEAQAPGLVPSSAPILIAEPVPAATLAPTMTEHGAASDIETWQARTVLGLAFLAMTTRMWQ